MSNDEQSEMKELEQSFHIDVIVGQYSKYLMIIVLVTAADNLLKVVS